MLDLQQLSITKIVVHHIPSRDDERKPITPHGGDALVEVTGSAIDMFVRRITKALGSRSHGLKADVRDAEVSSVFQNACEMMDCGDARFIELAQKCANQLAAAQATRPMDPCKLITITGEVSALQRKYVAFIKADLQDALAEKKQSHKKTLDHLRDIFMTESQRLYKIGLIQRTVAIAPQKNSLYDSEHHAIYLFDHLLNGMETRQAAYYFYSQFIGADLAMSDKRLTRDFYEKTKDFIKSQNFTPAKKIEYVEALRSELRSNEQTISVRHFSEKHIPKNSQAAYETFMAKANFPQHAITKDVEYVREKLKRRQKITFSTGVQITTPANQISLITMKEQTAEKTVVEIQGKVESSE